MEESMPRLKLPGVLQTWQLPVERTRGENLARRQIPNKLRREFNTSKKKRPKISRVNKHIHLVGFDKENPDRRRPETRIYLNFVLEILVYRIIAYVWSLNMYNLIYFPEIIDNVKKF